jgi:MoxR-like ATPase
VSTNFQAQAEGQTSEDIIRNLVELIGDPEPAKYERRKKGSLT